MMDLDQIAGFDWDDGNIRKSADKHDVSQAEAESIFFNNPLIVIGDAKHSETEQRFNALGKTAQNRLLHITFTLRQNGTMVRVISARDMHRKERKAYEQA
ncbi:MAG TPA: BrnT family toxin [Bradyrhizobium sp.]|nr:BrnT family toxin [Bradyrhizobium sp.]